MGVLEGDYSHKIPDLDKKLLFLKECTRALFYKYDVSCTDVTSGSLKVTLQGESSSLSKAVAGVKKSGLHLPNFGTLESAEEKQRRTEEELEREDTQGTQQVCMMKIQGDWEGHNNDFK